jgi:hypothetical protein
LKLDCGSVEVSGISRAVLTSKLLLAAFVTELGVFATLLYAAEATRRKNHRAWILPGFCLDFAWNKPGFFLRASTPNTQTRFDEPEAYSGRETA